MLIVISFKLIGPPVEQDDPPITFKRGVVGPELGAALGESGGGGGLAPQHVIQAVRSRSGDARQQARQQLVQVPLQMKVAVVQ